MEPQFLRGKQGRLFLMYRPAAGADCKGVVLLIPPFAEEMNKSRRMLALAARALTRKGYATALPDLHGTGDSDGDFGDAHWDGWVDDLRVVLEWLRGRHEAPVHLLALRAGALLAARLVADHAFRPASVVLWNPVTQGKQALTQFLRLSIASSLTGGGGENTADLRQRLMDGERLEIAGYTLAPALAQGLDQATVAPLVEAPPERLIWLEVSSRDEPALSPLGQRQVDAWQSAGVSMIAQAVPGDAFWSTAELVDVPELVAATEAVF